VVGVNPGLRPLGSYGGPTLTSPPSASSVILSASPPAPCAEPNDQRGVPRPSATGLCDMGSAQFDPPSPQGLSPPTGPAKGGTLVEITGSGFTHATSVLFGRAPARFWVVDDSHVDAVSPPGRGAQAVTVSGPDGTASCPQIFAYS
jgi:hypothetical protein